MREEKQSQEPGRDDHHGIISNKFCKWQLSQTFYRPPIFGYFKISFKFLLRTEEWGAMVGSATPSHLDLYIVISFWYLVYRTSFLLVLRCFETLLKEYPHVKPSLEEKWCFLKRKCLMTSEGWPNIVWEENFFLKFIRDSINIKFYLNLTQVFIVSIKKLALLPKINSSLGGILCSLPQ